MCVRVCVVCVCVHVQACVYNTELMQAHKKHTYTHTHTNKSGSIFVLRKIVILFELIAKFERGRQVPLLPSLAYETQNSFAATARFSLQSWSSNYHIRSLFGSLAIFCLSAKFK